MKKLPATMSEDDPQTEDEDDGNESQAEESECRDVESEDEDDGSESQTEGRAPQDQESEGTQNGLPVRGASRRSSIQKRGALDGGSINN